MVEAPPARIVFVGLGNMGSPMAALLAAAGHALTVIDARPETVSRFVAEHPAAVAGRRPLPAGVADIAITMLPNIDVVREVMLGPDGIAPALGEGAILIDMSSSSPYGTIALAAELAAAGIAMVDTPVSGGVARAVSGELTIMAGGDAATLDRCWPILQVMAGTLFRTGPLGSGQAMKALNNLCSAAGLLIAAEAVRAGRRFGLDPELMIDVLNVSTGQNNSTLRKFKPFVLPKQYRAGFGLDLMVKDIRAARDIIDREHVAAPLAQACVELWGQAQELLGPGQDHTAIDRWLELLSGGD